MTKMRLIDARFSDDPTSALHIGSLAWASQTQGNQIILTAFIETAQFLGIIIIFDYYP